MGKPIFDITYTKNKILLCIYVFRSLPVIYFETITSYDPQLKEKTRLIIKDLLKDDVLKKSYADNGSLYLRLTQKGYHQVAKNILPQSKKPLYTFRRDRAVNHTISDHHYYNFIFVWDWITKNPSLVNMNIQIYDDSNINNCVIPFSYDSKKAVVSPDILIFQPDTTSTAFRKTVIVENDAGGETYRRLFEKIIEYGVLFETGLQQNAISEATLYFIFHSETRAKQLLFGEKSILQFFDFANSTRKIKRLPIDTILKGFTKHKIYYSFYNKNNLQNPLLFLEYPLTKLLFERRKEWEIYR